MSRSQPIMKWFLLFFGLILIGLTGYFLYLSLSPNSLILNINEAPIGLNLNNNTPVKVPVVEPLSTPAVNNNSATPHLKNPFIRPLISIQKTGSTWLKYQGIIETENIRYGLVKVTANSKTYMVQEGQYVPELGLEVKKITSTALTYRKNNMTVVISLGGIKK